MTNKKPPRAEYRRLAKVLIELDQVNEAHQRSLVIYCEEAERQRELTALVEEEGVVLISDKGNKYMNPTEMVRKSCLSEMSKQQRTLGLDLDQLEKSARNL